MTQATTNASRSLGICVTTRGASGHLMGLVSAAVQAGISAEVFLSGEGVHVVRDRRFQELVASARVSVCDVSFRTAGFSLGDADGLSEKDFVTQWRNAEMVERCDRYLVL